MSDQEALNRAFSELINGRVPEEKLPTELLQKLLEQIAHFNAELAQTITNISNGQLDASVNYKGNLAGSVNALQASLKHLVWQTSAVANGDLSQKVAFMGEFSNSFNRMVENLRKNQKIIESKNRELEKDLALAEEIQKTMLGELAKVDFIDARLIYRPLHKVSGDFVFTHCSADRHYSAFLGDVSGHGIAAALITIMTKTALETILPNNPPDQVMRLLNSMLARSIPDGMYLTGALVKISPDGKMLTSNAAHPVIMLQRIDCNEVVKISGTGLALGMFAEEIENYSSNNQQLSCGDRIFVFSDGLQELKTNKGFLGIEGIQDIICSSRQNSLSETVQLLDSTIKKAAEINAVSDDLTVLALEYTGKHKHSD